MLKPLLNPPPPFTQPSSSFRIRHLHTTERERERILWGLIKSPPSPTLYPLLTQHTHLVSPAGDRKKFYGGETDEEEEGGRGGGHRCAAPKKILLPPHTLPEKSKTLKKFLGRGREGWKGNEKFFISPAGRRRTQPSSSSA